MTYEIHLRVEDKWGSYTVPVCEIGYNKKLNIQSMCSYFFECVCRIQAILNWDRESQGYVYHDHLLAISNALYNYENIDNIFDTPTGLALPKEIRDMKSFLKEMYVYTSDKHCVMSGGANGQEISFEECLTKF